MAKYVLVKYLATFYLFVLCLPRKICIFGGLIIIPLDKGRV